MEIFMRRGEFGLKSCDTYPLANPCVECRVEVEACTRYQVVKNSPMNTDKTPHSIIKDGRYTEGRLIEFMNMLLKHSVQKIYVWEAVYTTYLGTCIIRYPT